MPTDTKTTATTVLLKTPLFPFKDSAVPAGTTALSGELISSTGGGYTLKASRYADSKGRWSDGPVTTLFLPLHKIDHAVLPQES